MVKKKKLVDKLKSIVKTDGWQNIYTGLGSALDKITGHQPYAESWLDEETLEAIYQSDPIAQRIITELVDVAFRNGWNPIYKGDESNTDQINDESKAIMELLDGDDGSLGLNATQTIMDAIYWGRLYGRGGVLLGVDDGRDMSEPLEIESVREIRYLEAIDSRDFYPHIFYSDPEEPKYGKPEIWILQRYASGGSTESAMVHESRILTTKSGIPTSNRKLAEEKWRWQPILQSLYEGLRSYSSMRMSIANMITDSSIAVLKITGLSELLATEDLTAFENRMRILTMGRGIRVLPIDEDETYEYVERTFTGLKDTIMLEQAGLAADSKYPQVLLFGKGSTGLANEEITSDRNWTGQAKAAQFQWLHMIVKLVRMAAIVTGARDPENWSAHFKDVWQKTPEEVASHQKMIAETDKLYNDMQALTPEEIAITRFGSGEFDDGPVQIDSDARQAMIDDDMLRMKEGPKEEEQSPPVMPMIPNQEVMPKDLNMQGQNENSEEEDDQNE